LKENEMEEDKGEEDGETMPFPMTLALKHVTEKVFDLEGTDSFSRLLRVDYQLIF
jgi:hypothetical protein